MACRLTDLILPDKVKILCQSVNTHSNDLGTGSVDCIGQQTPHSVTEIQHIVEFLNTILNFFDICFIIINIIGFPQPTFAAQIAWIKVNAKTTSFSF